MAGNWRGGRPKSAGTPGQANPASERKHAPVGWRRHSGRQESTRSSGRLLQRSAGVAVVLLLAAGLYVLWMLLQPVNSQLFVDFGDYSADLVTPSLGVSPQELEEALPNLNVINLGDGDATGKINAAGATIVFVDAALLLTDKGPVIVDNASTPDSTRVARMQPFADGAERPASVVEWLRPILERSRQRPTLLILDVSQPHVNWRAGILAPFAAQRFLEECRSELSRASKTGEKKPQIGLLTSCRPGEIAWFDDGRSCFSRIVVEALHGAADGAIDGDTDGRVTAEEIHRYVAHETAAWVSGHRDDRGQHPVWMTSGADFDVAYVSKDSFAWPDPVAADEEFLQRLEAAWQRRDAAWKEDAATSPLNTSTLHWRRANHRLLQAEQTYLAGQMAAAREHLKQAETSLERLKGVAAASFDPPVPAAEQLASFRSSLPVASPPEELEKLVELRKAAQAAVTRAPRALPLVETLLHQADELRRKAEDVSFLGDRDQAGQLAGQSQALYETVSTAAGNYAQALRGLHRSLAGLPYLAEWAAAQPASLDLVRTFTTSDDNAAANLLANDNVTKVASLLVKTRQLREDLERFEQSPPAGQQLVSASQSLARRADEIVQAAAAVEAALTAEANDLLNRSDKVAARRLIRRQSIDHLLANLLLSGTIRRQLIQEMEAIDEDLRLSAASGTDEEGQNGAGSPDSGSVWDPEEAVQSLAKTAAWQGLWALLTRSLDPSADKSLDRVWTDDWRVVAAEAQLTASQRPEGAETAYKAAVSLGNRLQLSFRSAARDIGRSRGYDEESTNVWQDLTYRDRVGRSLHGYDSDQLVGQRKRDPADDLALGSSATTSLYLAQQSLDDFYAGASGGEHWFDSACQHHLDAARSTVRGVPAVSPIVSGRARQVESLLEQRRGTRFWLQPTPERVVFGSYDQRPASLRVEVDGLPPAGTAAVWLSAASGRSGDGSVGNAGSGTAGAVRIDTRGRRAIVWGASDGDSGRVAAFDLVRTSPDCNAVRLPARFFFRGHGSATPSLVTADPCPPGRRVVVTSPAPLSGGLVVNGIDRRSILFVLDCSDSMQEAVGNDGTRMEIAKRVLANTIQGLRDRAAADDDGQRVGLVPFGHRMNTQVENGRVVPLPNTKWPSNDLPQSASTDYQLLVPLSDINRRDGDEYLFEKQLGRLDHFGITPLIGAIDFAVGRFPAGVPGSVVVVTDGVDTDLAKGNAAQARAALSDLSSKLKNARDKGVPIQVHVAGFAMNANLLKEICDAVCDPSGGQRFDAADGNKLQTFLEETTRSREYTVVAEGQNSGDRYKLTETAKDLPRGTYDVRFPDAVPQSVSIAGGERLVLDLNRGRFEPRKYESGSAPGQRVRATGGTPDAPDLLVERSYIIEAGTARLTISLDRAGPDDGLGGPPQISRQGFVPRPGDVWFEVTDGAGRPVPNLSWQLAVGYDLPTWELSIPSAPSDQRLNVTAYWRTKPAPQDAGLVLSPSDVGREVTVPLGEETRTLVLSSFGQPADRPGVVVARLEPREAATNGPELEHLWAALDPGAEGSGVFRPAELRTERAFFYEEGTIEFAFSVGPQFDLSIARLGLIAPPMRQAGAAQATLRLQRAN